MGARRRARVLRHAQGRAAVPVGAVGPVATSPAMGREGETMFFPQCFFHRANPHFFYFPYGFFLRPLFPCPSLIQQRCDACLLNPSLSSTRRPGAVHLQVGGVLLWVLLCVAVAFFFIAKSRTW